MRVDLYTKGVLTVIAGCLIYLSMGKPAVLQTAAAQTAAPAPAPPQPAPQTPVKPLPQNPTVFGRAQTRPLPKAPTVLTGDDLGFRVERRMGGVVAGTWVVRIGDQWVPAEAMGRVVPLSH